MQGNREVVLVSTTACISKTKFSKNVYLVMQKVERTLQVRWCWPTHFTISQRLVVRDSVQSSVVLSQCPCSLFPLKVKYSRCPVSGLLFQVEIPSLWSDRPPRLLLGLRSLKSSSPKAVSYNTPAVELHLNKLCMWRCCLQGSNSECKVIIGQRLILKHNLHNVILNFLQNLIS